MTKDREAAPAGKSAPTHDSRLVHEPDHEKTKPATADAIVRGGVGHWNLTTGHPIYLGDIDRRETLKFPIYYLGGGNDGPRIDARLSGDPAIRLLHAPMSLPASSQPYHENQHFKVDFNPQRLGRFESVLEIDVLQSPHERHRVQVIGEAHAPGEPTREEEEELTRREEADEQVRREKQRKTKEENARLDKHNEQNHDYHQPALQDLGRAKDAVSASLSRLLLTRQGGVNAAKTEVENFVRLPPNNNSSLLWDLAIAAMQIATAGIGALVAKRLEPIVTSMLSGAKWARGPQKWIPLPPPDHFVSFFSEAIETSVQTVGGIGINKIQPGSESGSPGSANAVAEFFRIESDTVVRDPALRAETVAGRAQRSLEPMLEIERGRTERPAGANEAIAGLQRVADGIDTAIETASKTQMHESVKHWARYVAETNMAGRDPSQLRNIGAEYDGVVDLTFSATQANAASPVTVTHARLNGVKKAVVSRFIDIPLSQTGLAIRASCQFSPEQAVIVLKRPSGELEYNDTPPDAGSWLSHKAGVHARPKEADRARGARILFEEIARKSLQQHLTGLPKGFGDATRFVENDSDETK